VWKAGVPVDREARRAAIVRQKAEDEKARQAPGPAGSEPGKFAFEIDDVRLE
jgi:hypothetical protein